MSIYYNSNSKAMKQVIFGVLVILIVLVIYLVYSAPGRSPLAPETATTTQMAATTSRAVPVPAPFYTASDTIPTVYHPTPMKPKTSPRLEPTETTEAEPALQNGKAKVEIKNYTFIPATINVVKGTKVTWTNDDTVPHSISGELIDSVPIAPGDSFSFTFTQTGTFNYHCGLHPNMLGTVIVK